MKNGKGWRQMKDFSAAENASTLTAYTD